MSRALGKMTGEAKFPMEFHSLFQDNIAPFVLQSVLYWESMKRSSFHLQHKPEILMLMFFRAWIFYYDTLNLISWDTKILFRILAFNASEFSSNLSWRNEYETFNVYAFFRKPDILHGHRSS